MRSYKSQVFGYLKVKLRDDDWVRVSYVEHLTHEIAIVYPTYTMPVYQCSTHRNSWKQKVCIIIARSTKIVGYVSI